MLSRIDHKNPEIWASLAQMIKGILTEYTKQALWLLAAVVHSKDPARKMRAQAIIGETPVGDPFNISSQIIDVLCIEHDSPGQCISL